MQPSSTSGRDKNTYRFIVWFIAGLFAGILITYVVISSRKKAGDIDSNTALLNKETDSLKTEFAILQSLNSDYSSILEKSSLDTIQLSRLDSLNVLITRKELGFLEHIDSIDIANSNTHNSSSALLKNIVDGYRIAAKQSSAVSNIRNAFNIGNTNYSFDQNMLAAMQRELRAKETELFALQKKPGANGDTVNINHSPAAADSTSGNLIIALRRRNDVLATANKKLQNDIQQLRNRPVTSNTQTGTSNNISSSQSDKYVNEQISLAQADCYLTRADPGLIISSARQRTELLQSALKILNTLSNSGSDLVRKQAQERLVTFKKVAAKNHD